MSKPFASINDVITLFRQLEPDELNRAESLLPIVSDVLRVEAKKVGKDLDLMIADDDSNAYANVVKSVAVDVVARALMTPTDSAPMQQFSQSALGYTVSGTYLVPGGGLFIKNQELQRLGLKRQRMGGIRLD